MSRNVRHPPVADPRRVQWIIVDSKVYDVTKFKGMHPGGLSVFHEEDIGAHETFDGLCDQRARATDSAVASQPARTRRKRSMAYTAMRCS